VVKRDVKPEQKQHHANHRPGVLLPANNGRVPSEPDHIAQETNGENDRADYH
jgi:hypothetical protein